MTTHHDRPRSTFEVMKAVDQYRVLQSKRSVASCPHPRLGGKERGTKEILSVGTAMQSLLSSLLILFLALLALMMVVQEDNRRCVMYHCRGDSRPQRNAPIVAPFKYDEDGILTLTRFTAYC